MPTTNSHSSPVVACQVAADPTSAGDRKHDVHFHIHDRRVRTLISTCLTLLLIVASCDSPTSFLLPGETPVIPDEYERVAMVPEAFILHEGQTQQLTPAAAIQSNSQIIWQSTDSSVAQVSSTGVVTGIDAGAATIIAVGGLYYATSEATVTELPPPPPVATVTVTPASATLAVDATSQFSAEARDANNNIVADVAFTWESANPAVATVSLTGLVTAVTAGEVGRSMGAMPS